MMSSVCCLDDIAPTCTAALNGSTRSTSSSILKASYNGLLRRLLLIVKPYSASEMLLRMVFHLFLITSEMYIQFQRPHSP